MQRFALSLAAAALATAAGALDNGLARTPPMGWMTWCEPKTQRPVSRSLLAVCQHRPGPRPQRNLKLGARRCVYYFLAEFCRERFRCTTDAPGQGNPSCAEDPTNCISETLVKQHVDILALPEWRAAGYNYVDIDDCWEDWERTSDGKLAPNNTRFPSGMKALGEYVHAKGLQLGTYNDIGTKTCGGYPGECKDENCTLPVRKTHRLSLLLRCCGFVVHDSVA